MFEEGGDEALDPIPNSGGTSRMTEKQRLMICALLRLGARVNGFPTELWTLRRVRELIERETGIHYSISNVHLLMHAFGFSPQVAARRARAAYQQAREKERDFL